MEEVYKSVKIYGISFNKVNWIRSHMKLMGLHPNKSMVIDLALTHYAKMILLKMKENNAR